MTPDRRWWAKITDRRERQQWQRWSIQFPRRGRPDITTRGCPYSLQTAKIDKVKDLTRIFFKMWL